MASKDLIDPSSRWRDRPSSDGAAVAVPDWIFTAGASSMVGGIPQTSVRGLVALGIGQGFEWLQRKRDKATAEITQASARLKVVEQELSETFGAASAV